MLSSSISSLIFLIIFLCKDYYPTKGKHETIKISNIILHAFSIVRRDTCRMFRKKKRGYMKAIVNKLEENSKKKKKTFGKRIRGLMNSRRAINLAPI